MSVFGPSDASFDNSARRVGDHAEMVLARGSNLYGTTPRPAHGADTMYLFTSGINPAAPGRAPRPSGCDGVGSRPHPLPSSSTSAG